MVAGGCGPVHAWMLAEEIGVDRVYIPRVAPNFCAFGEVVADLRHEYSRAYAKRIDAVDPDELEALFEELEASGSSTRSSSPTPRTLPRSRG
jgi:N-methylhydantoinase A